MEVSHNSTEMEPVICFEMLFPNLPPEEKIARIAAAGFSAVEFWGWRDKKISALQKSCIDNGVHVANFSGHRRGDLIAPHTWAVFFEDLEDSVETARLLDCQTLMLLTNELGERGRVVNSYQDSDPAEKRRNLLRGIKEALRRTPEDFQLVLEPLNTRIDHPGYFLSSMDAAVSLVEEIDDPKLRILCDLYHMGMMGENLQALIQEHLPHIGYFHIADIPGRHEPGTGKEDWRTLLRQIARSGYKGPVGFEYAPAKDSAASLDRIRDLWDEVLG
jgi:hydroxypyruvate isomerase